MMKHLELSETFSEMQRHWELIEEGRRKLERLMTTPQKIKGFASDDQTRPEFVNIDQASKVLNLSKSTIYKRTMNNELPHYKHGKKLMFKYSELIEFINKHKVKPVEQKGIMIER